jgi:hypothetical protein
MDERRKSEDWKEAREPQCCFHHLVSLIGIFSFSKTITGTPVAHDFNDHFLIKKTN